MTMLTVMGPLTRLAVMVPPGDPDPAATGHGPEWGKAAPVGLLVWLLLGIALFLLIKSLNRHLRRVPTSFENGDAAVADGAPLPAPGATGGGDGAGSESAVGSGDASRDDAGGGDDDADAPPAAVPGRGLRWRAGR